MNNSNNAKIIVKQETLNRILEHGGKMRSALLEIIEVTNDVEIAECSITRLIEKLSQCREIAITAVETVDSVSARVDESEWLTNNHT